MQNVFRQGLGSKLSFESNILIKRGRGVKYVRNEFKLSLKSKVLMKNGEIDDGHGCRSYLELH